MTRANKATPKKANGNIHPLINLLVQLQELTLVRTEQEELSAPDKHLEQLDKSIASLLKELPADTRALFLKIQKKDPLAIVPISNQVCCGCGMSLPVSLIYAVKSEDKLYQCTNCARILYFPEVRPRGIGKKVRRTETRKTGIARFSSHTLMIPHIDVDNKEAAIEQLAHLVENEGFVDNGKGLFDETMKREAIINTAVDNGIAFPHVRGIEGGGLTVSLATSPKGIKYDPSTRNLTHIIFFIVIPTAASVFYLRLLSGLTQVFLKKENRDKLLEADSQDRLWKTLVKLTKTKIA